MEVSKKFLRIQKIFHAHFSVCIDALKAVMYPALPLPLPPRLTHRR